MDHSIVQEHSVLGNDARREETPEDLRNGLAGIANYLTRKGGTIVN
jgi:hypothetical protein